MDSHEVKEVDSAGLPGKSATDKPDITRVFVDDEGYIWLAALYASMVMKCSYKNGILKTESIHDIFPLLRGRSPGMKVPVQENTFVWTNSFSLRFLA